MLQEADTQLPSPELPLPTALIEAALTKAVLEEAILHDFALWQSCPLQSLHVCPTRDASAVPAQVSIMLCAVMLQASAGKAAADWAAEKKEAGELQEQLQGQLAALDALRYDLEQAKAALTAKLEMASATNAELDIQILEVSEPEADVTCCRVTYYNLAEAQAVCSPIPERRLSFMLSCIF